MEVRDPLYGLIEYNETEKALMNTWALQRLRRIHQLAMAYLVYPSAHHNRFEHSIGVMHLAGEVAKRLAKSLGCGEKEIELVRLAGLLHDVGHGPFSHVSERVLKKDPKMKGKTESLHESITADIILHWEEFDRIPSFSKEMREEVAAIISGKRDDYLSKIISGPIDVDKLDYLIRDSYFAGVKYGMFDLEKIKESITSVEGKELGIMYEGIHAIEQLLIASYHMREQVYRHRVRRITDAMLVEGLSRAVKSKRLAEAAENNHEFNIAKIYPYKKNSREYLKHYMGFYDEKVLSILSDPTWEGESFYPLFKRLKERRLLKEVLSESLTKFAEDMMLRRSIRDKIENRNIKLAVVESIYNNLVRLPEFSQDFGITKELIIVDLESTKSPAYDLWEQYISGRGYDIIIVKNGQTSSFMDESKIFAPPPSEDERTRISIYLPLDNTDTKKREEIRGRWVEPIKQAIKEVFQR